MPTKNTAIAATGMNLEQAFEVAKSRGCTIGLPKSFADMWRKAEKQGKEFGSFGLTRTKQGKEYVYFDTQTLTP